LTLILYKLNHEKDALNVKVECQGHVVVSIISKSISCTKKNANTKKNGYICVP